MKHLLKLVATFVFAAFLFTSCKECDVTTTQIEEADVDWLVYDRNDTIYFLSDVGDTILYRNTLLRAEQVPGEGYNASDNCIGHFDVQAVSVMEDVDRVAPGIAVYFLKRENLFEVKLLVDQRGEFNLNLAEPTYETYELNDVVYTDVYQITSSNASNEKNVSRILFNKAHGFLSMEFHNGKKLELIPN
jgi:hypothetical protein